jgi:hypothetical protein
MQEVPMLPIRIDFKREGRIVDIKTVNAMADLLKNSWPYEQTPSYRRVLLACFKSLRQGMIQMELGRNFSVLQGMSSS